MNRGVVSAPNGMNLMVTKMFGGARNDHEVQNISDINLEMEEWLNSQIIVVNLIKEEKSTINIPDEDCFICGIDNVNVETVCCSHYYCYRCLNMWFHRENPSCPNCRGVLEKCFVKTL